MEHKTRQALQRMAAVHNLPAMTRNERLHRWAELLERAPDSCLSTLTGTEHQAAHARQAMRARHSAISVAFADPILRAEGLASDTYGEAQCFFALTDRQLHDIVCHCHNGDAGDTRSAARLVRAATRPGKLHEVVSGVVFYSFATAAYGSLLYCLAIYLVAP
jgi:hypothetical protein